MSCGSGCGCGSHEEEPDLTIPSPEPPPISPTIERMSEEERESFRKVVQQMRKEDIEKLDDDKFAEMARWIMEYTSWLYSTAEHKVIMAVVRNDYPQWFDVFIERFGMRNI